MSNKHGSIHEVAGLYAARMIACEWSRQHPECNIASLIAALSSEIRHIQAISAAQSRQTCLKRTQ